MKQLLLFHLGNWQQQLPRWIITWTGTNSRSNLYKAKRCLPVYTAAAALVLNSVLA